MNSRQNSIHLFRFAGIDVFLHWSWFLVAVYEIGSRPKAYSSLIWNVLEYLALFLIVMLHEFGHALACQSNHALAYGRRRLCGPAAKARRDAVEHRRWTVGECGADSDFGGAFVAR